MLGGQAADPRTCHDTTLRVGLGSVARDAKAGVPGVPCPGTRALVHKVIEPLVHKYDEQISLTCSDSAHVTSSGTGGAAYHQRAPY